MSIVKINQKTLRKIIESEVKNIVEGVNTFGDYENTGQDVANLVDKIGIVWVNMPEEGDPSIEAAGGWETWESQVEVAKDELLNAFNNAINTIEQNLMDGQYYRQHHRG